MAEQSDFKIRGVMFDSGRLIEKHRFYFDLLPYLAKWGYNTLFWHFTDNDGCALQFDCAPELSSKNAFSKRETEDLISCAADHGLQVIPELETLGHAKYITDCRKYRHLLETQEGPYHTTLCPSHPDTRKLMEALIAEIASVFPAPYIHVGLDEANFGSCPRCWFKLQKTPKWKLFADHVRLMRGFVRSHKKQMMMWGDHLLSGSKYADAIPRDVIICDWHYEKNVKPASVELLTKKGFQVICCPATMQGGTTIFPDEDRLRNVKAFSKIARTYCNKGCLGVMTTNWSPYGHLQAAPLHAIAMAGYIFNDCNQKLSNASYQFVQDYFDMSKIGRAHV